MGKLVVLNIGEGNFECGFPVTLQIGDDGVIPSIRILGNLPPCAEIPQQYEHWRLAYLNSESDLRLGIPVKQFTNYSIKENLHFLHKSIYCSINTWLKSKQFYPVREKLLQMLVPSDEIRVLIQTENPLLHRLPWHLWDFFEQYPKAEVALSTPVYEQAEHSSLRNFRNPVRILAILGNSQAIDLQQDRDLLEKKLTGAEICFLAEPKREELIDKLWEQSWDIFFFAGHSSSETDDRTGQIYINQTDRLTITELKYPLRKAIKNGLKLAIFNSCDGLGLAGDLAGLNIPQFILMREPVPDQIAQNFLKYFLEAFARGELFYLAVREARERLQSLEAQIPGATWLPIIYQNPTVVPPTWPKQRSKQGFGKVLFANVGIITTLLITGIPAWQAVRNFQQDQIILDQISLGEEILVNSVTSIYKKEGVQAFALKNYVTASKYFQKSLQQNRNDPETLIYFNNAKIGNSSAFKIAVTVPINSNPNLAQEILRGVAQAQDEVNRNGGINEKLLQVEIANDDNDPVISKRIATELIANPQILAVVGHYASDASIAACPVYQQGKLVMISPTNSAPNRSGCGSYIFRTIPSISFIAYALANYTIKMARTTDVAICSDSTSMYSQSFANEFTNAIISNSSKFINIGCDFSASDFNPSAAISQAISNKVDVLLLAPSVDSINKALDVAKANKKRLALVGSPTLYTAQTRLSGQASVEGLVLAVPWHPAATPGNPFTKNAMILWGGTVSWRTAMAYDATKAIITGLTQSNTRDELQKVLSNPAFSVSGATGTIQFLPSGDRQKSAILVKVIPNSQSATGYDFVPLTSR